MVEHDAAKGWDGNAFARVQCLRNPPERASSVFVRFGDPPGSQLCHFCSPSSRAALVGGHGCCGLGGVCRDRVGEHWEKLERGEDVRSAARREITGGAGGMGTAGWEPGGSILNLGANWRVRAQRSGLVLPSELSFEVWRQIGSQVFAVANSCAWWVGDWLSYGENYFGDRYEQAITGTSLDYQTLRNYAWVAKKFRLSRRRDSLSFGHHAEVAALTEAEQDEWLTRAERFNWSRNELRRRIRATRFANRPKPLQESATKTTILKIEVPVERLDRWQHAAERMDCSVAEWVITELDRAATPEF